MHASGEKIMCLGGGRSAGEGIHILGGKVDLVGNGVSVVCFGSYDGAANITVRDADLKVHADGNEVLLVGSHSGDARIIAENSKISLSSACEVLTAFGTMNGHVDAVVSDCNVVSDTHCDKGAVFGSFYGEASICFRDSKVRLFAQESDHTPVSPAGTPLCFANPSKDHYEAVFRDIEHRCFQKVNFGILGMP